VRGFFEFAGTAYLVMEYLDGQSLRQIVREKGPIAANVLLPKLQSFLKDVEKLHKAGIIHRDIGPDNVMLMPDGSLKLLDFGCARSMEDGKSMTVMVKNGYAPIEQYQSHGQGPYTDVYAICATVYYCLTGRVPPSAVERLEEDIIVAPNALGAGLTGQQEQALLWGLTVQPKYRPISIEVFYQRFFGSEADKTLAPSGHARSQEAQALSEDAGKFFHSLIALIRKKLSQLFTFLKDLAARLRR